MRTTRVAVVGGGLGGLTAAALLARGGCEVSLYERSKHLGGRAQTSDVEGFRFNLGPHALYRGGAAMRVLGSLGVKPKGGIPGEGSYALRAGRLHTLPRGAVSLMTTDVLTLAGKLELARLLAGLPRIDTEPLSRVSMREWLATRLSREDARALVGALTRVSTYCADLDSLSAEVAVSQLQMALAANVLYLDGGWSSLVDALEARAREAGAKLELSARVESVVLQSAQVHGLELADGTVREVDAVVLAGSPGDVASLVPGDAVLARDAADAVPVKAATLELGMSSLPRPEALFALGVDGPWYASVHSASARLAPEGGAMVHVMKYLTGADADPREADLEGVMDVLQPGWREHVVAKRFRPSLTVTHLLPSAKAGGLASRPTARVPHVSGLFRVGDWVGPEGMLADAAFASAESVARTLMQRQAAPRRAVGA
ncbi:NAD(P)/FAD-dependent oxidoreductase [Pyxidicoccus parkwayensis]|uniref:NAD(P)/FAD-dependent oxidoreductase n=1 Tax=Pyxidicoccus parkwayensis TaxID=2813578 RepID=A0ABX7NS38_9BACT|nr:FAD-dependent oxidoreductase [Pyxidicoccus parkwaysis]QSQ21216.1 NAD(P)/FAD-dependent oxidoreductase [Pyxidicoccus parkwaysis]